MRRKNPLFERTSLLCVKSIMTIALTVMLCVMTYMYPDQYSETFKNCIVMIVTFYFAHQTAKEVERNEDAEQRKAEANLPKRHGVNSTLGTEENQEENKEEGGEE